MRVMEIRDLFDSADQSGRIYIAWRMSQVTNDLCHAVRYAQPLPDRQKPREAKAAA
jgi:hypothetical protein